MEKFATFILKKRNLLFSFLTISAIICAYLMTLVTVNMDMTEYLPEDSNVRAGILVVQEEFGDLNTPDLHVMFEDLTAEQQLVIYEQLVAFEHVVEVLFDATSEAHVVDEFTLYTLMLEQGLTSEEEYQLVNGILATFNDFTVEMSGDVEGVDIDLNMMLITIPTVIILTVILFFMCRSWIEPVLLFINIGIAIFINMGTNMMFDSISDITQMIAGLLQVALSMDYSIIFLNRYRLEKEMMGVEDHKLAMRNTIRNSFSTISGISFTTIVGMLMLVFMSFTIGADIGFVIAKGVFISLLCVFGVMPALILWFDKLIDQTAKPALSLKMGAVGRFGYKARYVVALLFVSLFAGAFVLQNQIEITYSEVDYDPIHQVFDLDNTFVVLYEHADEANMGVFIDQLEERRRILGTGGEVVREISDIQSYGTTIGAHLTAIEMAAALEMDETLVGLVFRNYFFEVLESVNLGSFMQFLEFQAIHHPLFAGMISFETMGEPITHYTHYHDTDLASLSFTNEQIATLFQLDLMTANQLLHLYHFSDGDLATLDEREPLPYTMTLPAFIAYLVTDFAQIPLFESAFPPEVLATLAQSGNELVATREMFVSENFSRMIINTTFDFESEATFAFMDEVIAELDDLLEGRFYLLGTSAMPHEMRQTFPGEYRFITILTTLAFFVVVAISFKSMAVAAILAIAIQAAVFITMGVTYFQDGGIMFLPLIIAQVLLKSRVIDYGILYTANYIEARKEYGVKEAMIHALNRSIDTILTSGLIIVLVTFVVGLIFMGVNVAISEILLLIAQGCFIGIMLSIFVLPSLIAVFDRFVTRAKVKSH